MTLLENTYRQLRRAELVECAEAFSKAYLGRNKNWYAYQKHAGRDYSVDAAVQCLRYLRSKQQAPVLSAAQRQVLRRLEQQLLAHLTSQHCIADVC